MRPCSQEQAEAASSQGGEGPVRRGGIRGGQTWVDSDECLSVDGTLIEAATSIKSFRRRDDDDDMDRSGNTVSRLKTFAVRS